MIVVNPFNNFSELYQLQTRHPKSELFFSIIRPLVILCIQDFNSGNIVLYEFAESDGHTHRFENPLKPSNADTRSAIVQTHSRSFVLSFNELRSGQLSYFKLGGLDYSNWVHIFDNQPLLEQKLNEFGLLK